MCPRCTHWPNLGRKKWLSVHNQAISGAGKTFEAWPEMVDNVTPFVGGEEEKSKREPLKIWRQVEDNQIVNADEPEISAQCLRVPVTDGHLVAVSVSFEIRPSTDTID